MSTTSHGRFIQFLPVKLTFEALHVWYSMSTLTLETTPMPYKYAMECLGMEVYHKSPLSHPPIPFWGRCILVVDDVESEVSGPIDKWKMRGAELDTAAMTPSLPP